MKKFLTHLYQDLVGTFTVFIDESKAVFTDAGVIIFFFVVPLLYPILYSWLYNNETVKDVPTVVVDLSHTSLSRDFIHKMDASEGIRVKYFANSLGEGKEVMMAQDCRAVVVIPEDFSSKLIKKEQNIVSLYVDMSGILYYKSTLISLTDVALSYGISDAPLQFEAVPIFNPSAGYGSFLLPAVLMIIIQQTLLLGIGLAAGTARENNSFGALVSTMHKKYSMAHIVIGKALCYFLIYLVLGSYVAIAIPHLFHFPQLATQLDILALLIPYILASIFLGMSLTALIRYRENVILIIVFTSVPLLFLSGISWPEAALTGTYKAVSYMFPSTFGVNGFVKLNSMGAQLADIRHELLWLWTLTSIYFVIACFVYWMQINKFRNNKLKR